LYAIILVAGLGVSSQGYWRNAMLITTYNVLLPWMLFLIIRYSKIPGQANKLHGLIKGGICVIIVGIYLTVTNNVINEMVGGGTNWRIADADFTNWGNIAAANANIWLIVLVSTTLIGLMLIIAGIIVQKSKKVEAE